MLTQNQLKALITAQIAVNQATTNANAATLANVSRGASSAALQRAQTELDRQLEAVGMTRAAWKVKFDELISEHARG